MDAVLGTAGGMIGGKINEAVQNVLDPDNKKVNWDELVAPVPQEMIAQYPGHELFAIPDHNTLVLHQKMEATEILAGLVSDFTDMDLGIETPNTYAIRTRDEGTTFYLLKEDQGVASSCMRDQCRSNMPYKFYAMNMRTGQQVATLDSPCACDDCCCGVWCIPCCIPVCCCMRTATWTMTTPDGGEGRVLATMRKVPLFGPTNCCDRQFDIEVPESGKTFSMYRSNFPGKACCCNPSEMHFIDEQHPYETPLGRMWAKVWVSCYQPTSNRYPPLPPKSIMGQVGNVLKEIGKDLIGSDADTFLVELPFDGIAEKAGAMLGALMYDMVYCEINDADDTTPSGEDAPVEEAPAEGTEEPPPQPEEPPPEPEEPEQPEEPEE